MCCNTLVPLTLPMAQFSILSLNCHGFNIGIESYLARICDKIDIILLQETWLSDFTCDRITAGPLSKYSMVHTSAMEEFEVTFYMVVPLGGLQCYTEKI